MSKKNSKGVKAWRDGGPFIPDAFVDHDKLKNAEDRQIARERADQCEERKGVRYEDEPPMSEEEYQRYWAEVYRGGYEGYDE